MQNQNQNVQQSFTQSQFNQMKKQELVSNHDKEQKEVIKPEEDIYITVTKTKDQLVQGADNLNKQIFKALEKSSKPHICIFHMFFKIIAFVLYVIGPLFFGNSSMTLNIVILFCVILDFWGVKNITGRQLVGLRWWSEVNEQLEDQWYFECQVDENNVNKFDYNIFWGIQYAYTIVCALLIFFQLFSFNFTNIIRLGFMFTGAAINLFAFKMCSKQQQAQVKNILEKIKLIDDNKELLQSVAHGSVKMPLFKQ